MDFRDIQPIAKFRRVAEVEPIEKRFASTGSGASTWANDVDEIQRRVDWQLMTPERDSRRYNPESI